MLIDSLYNIFIAIDNNTLSTRDIRRINRGVEQYFNGTMPKKYWIFPYKPCTYMLSKTVCIELPSYGNQTYRKLLSQLESQLKYSFKFDVELFNGNTTFIIKGIQDDLFDLLETE